MDFALPGVTPPALRCLREVRLPVRLLHAMDSRANFLDPGCEQRVMGPRRQRNPNFRRESMKFVRQLWVRGVEPTLQRGAFVDRLFGAVLPLTGSDEIAAAQRCCTGAHAAQQLKKRLS